MTKAAPPAPDPLSFNPVPRQRMRRGGWSADRQRQFIALLAETGSVRAAYRRLGVGEHHIYKLRNHPEAASYVTSDEVRARIDKKITEVRCRVEKEQAAMWARLSDKTNAAWERFVELRERDLDAVGQLMMSRR